MDGTLITEELSRRSPRLPNLHAENQAMHTLARLMADQPQTLLTSLVTMAVDLCQAGSAGVSLLEMSPDCEEYFRWAALAGAYAVHEGATMPRHFSPCGACLEQGTPLLYRYPQRCFTYLQQAPVLVEALVLPLQTATQLLGTIWILSHDEQRQFDSEDVRMMTSLADFAAAALSMLKAHQTAEACEQRLDALVNDISDRERLEDELRRREREFSTLIENLPDIVFRLDRNLRHVYISPIVERVSSIAPQQFLGKTGREVGLPADACDLFEAKCQEAFKTGQVTQIEFRVDGKHYQSRIIPERASDGSIQSLMGITEDVTERKQADSELKQAEMALRESEAKLTSFVEANVVGILFGDIYGGIGEANDELLRIVGYTREDLQAGRLRWTDITPPEYLYLDELHIAEARTKGACTPYEKEYIRKDGSRIPVLVGYNLVGEAREESVAFILDITERKQAKQQLQQTLQTLQTLITASPVAIVVIELDDCIVQLWNPAAEQLFGWCEAEVLGKPLVIVPEEKREECRQMLEAVVNGEVFSGVETYRGKRDSSSVIVSMSAAPLNDSRGNTSAIVLIFQDITKRQQAEEALRQSEERARLAIKVGRLGTWRYDPDTDLVELDERMREIWGEPDDAVKLPLPRVMERVHPDDRADVASAVGAAIDPKTSKAYEIDYRIVWNDGTERWVSANGQAQFEGEGVFRRAVGFFGTALDITDRKRAAVEQKRLLQREQQYRMRLQKLAEAFLAINATLSLNQRLQLITEQARDIIGTHQSVTSLTTNENLALLIQTVSVSDKYAQGHGFGEAGHPLMCGGLAAPLTNSNGENIGQIQLSDKYEGEFTEADEAILVQLAQMASAAIDNAQLYEESQQANRIKDEFLAVLSHELRSPLNPILGWTQLLRTRKLDKQASDRALETIERNVKLQTQLIEDLLDVSRILRRKMVLNVAAVDLSTTIKAALETVRLAAESKAIQIQTLLTPIASVSGDATRLQQVIWNLLSNAVKFTPSGGRVEVRLEQDASHAQIIVSDTGKGIAPEFLPYVFEYFRQEDGKTTRKFGGLGLGLAIVRYITELHGGSVYAESPGEGQGATFIVRLPLMQDEGGRMRDEEDYSSVLAPHSSPLTGLRILVVDDEPDMQELMLFTLEQTQAEVRVVASAAAALTVFDQLKPDILISDIGMPDVDGYMLIQQIRKRSPEQGGQIPAIALTAYAGEFNQQKALEAGFQRHIAKPVDPAEITKVIADLTRG